MLEMIEGRRRRGHQRIRRLDGITNAMNMNLGKVGDGEERGGLLCCSPWGHKELDTTGRLNNSSPKVDDFHRRVMNQGGEKKEATLPSIFRRVLKALGQTGSSGYLRWGRESNFHFLL